MVKRIQEIDQALRHFLEQLEQTVLLLSCRNEDLVVAAKCLLALSSQPEAALVLGTSACESIHTWLDDLVARVQADLEMAAVEGSSGGTTLPLVLPLDAYDSRLAPEQRFESLVGFCTSVLPQDVRVTWVLLPLGCADAKGYQLLAKTIVARPQWAIRHRFILWDDGLAPCLVPHLLTEKDDLSRVLEIDFSPAALLDDLVQSASDPAASMEARVADVFQLAAIDYAYKRDEDAMQKYQWVFAQCEEAEVSYKVMCLQGAANIAHRRGQLQQALDYIRSSLATALSDKSPQPVLLASVLMSAGEFSVAAADYESAIGYFDFASRMAATNLNPFARAYAILEKGRAQEGIAQKPGLDEVQRAQQLRAAVESYESCCTLCCAFDDQKQWNRAMEQKIGVLTQLGAGSKLERAKELLDLGFEYAKGSNSL